MRENILLETADLCIGYDGKSIVDDICLSIAGGSYLCIVGENGTGKSTLLKTISGLLKPVYGTVRFSVPRREIGYLPQQTSVQQDFPASAKEIVASGALGRGKWYRPFLNREEKGRIAWACEKTGVAAFAQKCFRELSGGQQRRVLLARALVTAKNVIIMDEPTSGLDPDATREFYELLAKINNEGITIIMVTHDIVGVKKYASHIMQIFGKNEKRDESEEYYFGSVKDYIRGVAHGRN